MAESNLPGLMRGYVKLLKPRAFDALLALHDAFEPDLLVYNNNVFQPTARLLHTLRGTTFCFAQHYPRSITSTEPPV
eukprot:256515-Prymnesium_polylepis.1